MGCRSYAGCIGLEYQGYSATRRPLYQNNESAMVFEKNGKKSITKRTKHINVRYYFVNDRYLKWTCRAYIAEPKKG